MLGFLFLASLGDFTRLKRIGVWFFACLALFGLGKVYVYVSNSSPDNAYNDLASLLVYRVLMLVAAVYASAVIAQEVEQKTIVYLVTRPIPRSTLILSRLAAATVVVAAISLAAAFTMSLATHGPDALNNPHLWHDAKALIVGSMAYTSLFTLVTLLINRAMIVNLLFAFMWETATANMAGNIYKLSVFSYLKSIAEKPPSTAGPLGILAGNRSLENISPGTAWIVMAILIVACSWLASEWFSRFAYLPREDAE